MLRSVATFFHGRNAFYVALLLLPPLLWLGTVYLGSLFALLMQSFYAIDEFTARIVRSAHLAQHVGAVSSQLAGRAKMVEGVEIFQGL